MEYQLSYEVIGTGTVVDLPPVPAGTTTWADNIFNPQEVVRLTVNPIYPNGCICPSDDVECQVGDCPQPTFTDDMDDVCWNGTSGIDLLEPSATDENGTPLTGEIEWDDLRVLSTGVFTPDDTENSMSYSIDFVFIDDVSGCRLPGSITVPVNIRPMPELVDLNPICEGGTLTWETTLTGGWESSANAVWTFPGGDPGAGTGEGPFDVTYASAGNFITELVVTSGPGCIGNVAIATVIDGPPRDFTIECGATTNTTQEWAWTNVSTVYNVTLVDLSTGLPHPDFDDETITRTSICLLYTSPSPRDQRGSRMPSSA